MFGILSQIDFRNFKLESFRLVRFSLLSKLSPHVFPNSLLGFIFCDEFSCANVSGRFLFLKYLQNGFSFLSFSTLQHALYVYINNRFSEFEKEKKNIVALLQLSLFRHFNKRNMYFLVKKYLLIFINKSKILIY